MLADVTKAKGMTGLINNEKTEFISYAKVRI